MLCYVPRPKPTPVPTPTPAKMHATLLCTVSPTYTSVSTCPYLLTYLRASNLTAQPSRGSKLRAPRASMLPIRLGSRRWSQDRYLYCVP